MTSIQEVSSSSSKIISEGESDTNEISGEFSFSFPNVTVDRENSDESSNSRRHSMRVTQLLSQSVIGFGCESSWI